MNACIMGSAQPFIQIQFHCFGLYGPVIFSGGTIGEAAVVNVDQPIGVALQHVSGAAHMILVEDELSRIHGRLFGFGIDLRALTLQ